MTDRPHSHTPTLPHPIQPSQEWRRRGGVWLRETESTSLFAKQTPGSFLVDFDYGINPLAGCPFACADCYVPALPNVRFRKGALPDGRTTNLPATWGSWVEVRVKSPEVLERALRSGKLDGTTLFMSALSDIYWPGEREYRLTRRLLEQFAARPRHEWLLVSTRSDLALRDLDLFQQLGHSFEIGISIPTDLPEMAARFGRRNPSLSRRYETVRHLVKAGIPTRVQISPLQPHSPDFARTIADLGAWVWLDWHTHFAAGFKPLYRENGLNWSTPESTRRFAEELQALMPAGWVKMGQATYGHRAPRAKT